LNYDLPSQLKWAEFIRAVEALGWDFFKSKPGSARTYIDRKTGEPATFHEPHGGDTLRKGTLREYLTKINVSHDRFMEVLRSGAAAETRDPSDEERFTRRTDVDGTVISNCNSCCNVVLQSKVLSEIDAAESMHPCYLTI
jgi:predicted RNA binding protein YcfA (HicA-like mRNA interferase family)